MIKKTAVAISILMHPLLMPSYLLSLLYFLSPDAFKPIDSAIFLRILFVIFVTTFVLPLISMFSMKHYTMISSLSMDNRRERILPFLIVTGFYGVTAYMFYAKIRINEIFFVLMVAITVLIVLVTLVTAFWKISVHSTAIGGAMGILCALYFKIPIGYFTFSLAALSMLAGVIMWSRLSLNAHKPEQVYAGALLGFVYCMASTYYFL